MRLRPAIDRFHSADDPCSRVARMDASVKKPAGVEASPGLVSWMMRHRASLVCSSYQTGRLLFIGSRRNGAASFTRAQFSRAMGPFSVPQRLFVARRAAVLRLEHTLKPEEGVDARFARLFVPRNAQISGNLAVHELVVEPSGRIVFVNTKFSCLATVSMTHAFRPLWRPSFISRLAPEDRCHLNG